MTRNTSISADTKSILLLCGVLGKSARARILTQSEYTVLVRHLIKTGLRPGDLLEASDLTQIALGARIDPDRFSNLLSRGVQLGFALEEWERNGIWVVSRGEQEYPERMKKHLGEKAPPLLFCIGNPDLLAGGGVAVVGSRNVDEKGKLFARRVAKQCALENLPVVSGGARGVDQTAMLACIESGGDCIGIVSDSLLRHSLEHNARKAISDGRLLLLSPYHPEAGFSVGNAMARNKLIYAMAQYAVVVSAETGKGGTWTGAREELARSIHRQVFVRIEEGVPTGNRTLIELGAEKWPEAGSNLAETLVSLGKAGRETNAAIQNDLFGNMSSAAQARETARPYAAAGSAGEDTKLSSSVFQAVMPLILERLDSPKSGNQLADELKVTRNQMSIWLKLAIQQGVIRKLHKPVRYTRA